MANIPFILLCISTAFLLIMVAYIASTKQKTKLHYAFIFTIMFAFFYSLASIFEKYFILYYNYQGMLFARFAYLGFSFLPVSFLFVGKVFAHSIVKLKQVIPWIIIPLITNIILWIDISLFFVKYNGLDQDNIYGFYNNIHVVYSYLCLFIAFYYLIKFSIRKSGIFSKQAFLIFLGTIVPTLLNIQFTLSEKYHERFLLQGLDILYSPYITPITFSFAILCYAIAIIRYDFLNIIPIATEKVVNQISDLFVVIDSKYRIISYNEPFETVFSQILSFKRKDNLIELIKSKPILDINVESLELIINESKFKDTMIKKEKHLQTDYIDKWYIIEISGIDKKKDLGTIILFKDVTELKQTQEMLAKQDRLAVLGQLAGGIAHEINNPANAVQTGLFKFKTSIKKIELAQTKEEIIEIVKGLTNVLDNCNDANRKVLEIAASVKNHTRNLSKQTLQNFDIKEFINKEMFMLEHLFKNNNCIVEIIEKDNLKITSDPGKLSQVILNLVSNAVQAYDHQPGNIQILIYKSNNNAVIAIKDFAGGIPEQIKDGAFEKILSTKGTNGTGLGLFISHSIVTGNLSGKLWFETIKDEGTTFYIELPIEIK